MSETRYASVLGLGFGDCGKGRFVDALARRWQAHTVVRFNGGAQAGHNVVESSSLHPTARHHTFSQFGSGSFLPGVTTVLIHPVVVHPTALLVESETLQRKGIAGPLSRILIDARCRVTTPYHQAAGRLRELLRAGSPHGSCGVGVGETVSHGIAHPEETFRYADLIPSVGNGARLEKLHAIRRTLLHELLPLCPSDPSVPITAELRTLTDETIASRWLAVSTALARQCLPAQPEEISSRLTKPGCVLFEGAQGILLDEWYGFHPHTTWSSITTSALEDAIRHFGITSPIFHLGAIRTHLTRHGAGPLPTHDPSLDPFLPEPHNPGDGWQGPFRRGHPDAILLRYALQMVGRLQGLLVSHLDAFSRTPFRWCESYTVPDIPKPVTRLPVGQPGDLEHQEALTRLLQRSAPVYHPAPVSSPGEFLARLTTLTPLPVILTSHGPGQQDVSPA